MGKIEKTLDRVLRGTSDSSIAFNDLRNLLKHLGFEERIRSSHHIFTREDLAEILNLQPRGNQAKPYQVKQVRRLLLDARLVHRDPDDEPTAVAGGEIGGQESPLHPEVTEGKSEQENKSDDPDSL